MYVLVNGHTIWRNSPNALQITSRDNLAQSEFRFSVIRVWYALYRKTNGRMDVLCYPLNRQTHHKRKLAMTVTSPRKGRHEVERITNAETSSQTQRLKCRICKRKTSYKCSKCSRPGDPLVLCSIQTGRQCWNEYHVAREYDIPSSQSQEELWNRLCSSSFLMQLLFIWHVKRFPIMADAVLWC